MSNRNTDARLAKFWQWFDSEIGPDGDFESLRKNVLNNHLMYPDTLEERLENSDESLALIDTRSEQEFNDYGHVAGAINMPLDAILENPALLEDHRNKDIALICNTGSTTSLYGAIFLLRKDFKSVFSVDQGMDGWAAQGGQISY
jgi:rhodanese-related sulfurtransferase